LTWFNFIFILFLFLFVGFGVGDTVGLPVGLPVALPVGGTFTLFIFIVPCNARPISLRSAPTETTLFLYIISDEIN
jgi:hypothetical protein